MKTDKLIEDGGTIYLLRKKIEQLEARIKKAEPLPDKWDKPIGKPSVDEVEFHEKMQRRVCAQELRTALQESGE